MQSSGTAKQGWNKGKLFRCGRKMLECITVEPIIFLNFFAIAYYSIPMQTGLYQVLCQQIYPLKDCRNLEYDPAAEDVIQRTTSLWNQVMAACYLAPAVIADILMGSLGDIYGRKLNILIGITGLVLSWFPTMLVLAYPNLPLIILPVCNIIAGVTGFLTIVVVSSYAYMADIVPNKEHLTSRMVVLQMVNSIASVIGSITAALFIRVYPPSSAILISIILIFLAFIYTLFRIKQIPPETMRRLVLMKGQQSGFCKPEEEVKRSPARNEIEMLDGNGKDKSELKSPLRRGIAFAVNLCALLKGMLKDVYLTYTKPRPGYNRMFIWIALLVDFIYTMIDMGIQNSVLSLYLIRRPFSWTPNEISTFKGVSALINTLGSIIGILLLKRILKFGESTIIIISLISSIADRTFMAFSSADWMIYAAATCGCLSTLLMPTMKSFTAQMVAPDEVGKLYTGFGIGSDIAHLMSAILLNMVYQVTVSTFPGCVFLVGAALSVVGVLLFLFIRFVELKQSLRVRRQN